LAQSTTLRYERVRFRVRVRVGLTIKNRYKFCGAEEFGEQMSFEEEGEKRRK
jgi:hypothetical protein